MENANDLKLDIAWSFKLISLEKYQSIEGGNVRPLDLDLSRHLERSAEADVSPGNTPCQKAKINEPSAYYD